MLGTILPGIQLYTYKIIPQEYYTAVVSGMTVDSAHLLFFFPSFDITRKTNQNKPPGKIKQPEPGEKRQLLQQEMTRHVNQGRSILVYKSGTFNGGPGSIWIPQNKKTHQRTANFFLIFLLAQRVKKQERAAYIHGPPRHVKQLWGVRSQLVVLF